MTLPVPLLPEVWVLGDIDYFFRGVRECSLVRLFVDACTKTALLERRLLTHPNSDQNARLFNIAIT